MPYFLVLPDNQGAMTTVLKHLLSAPLSPPLGEVKSIVGHHTKRSSASPRFTGSAIFFPCEMIEGLLCSTERSPSTSHGGFSGLNIAHHRHFNSRRPGKQSRHQSCGRRCGWMRRWTRPANWPALPAQPLALDVWRLDGQSAHAQRRFSSRKFFGKHPNQRTGRF